MKILPVLAAIALILCITSVLPTDTAEGDVLRIHVRANSNSTEDQQIKMQVKDAIVGYLTPLLADCDTKQKAKETVKENINGILSVANEVLQKNGFCYEAEAAINREYFPARNYQSLTLPDGEYDALIVSLGGAKGDNWWCVVYPPLCFINATDIGTDGIEYRSKLLEIIRSFWAKRKSS